MPNSSFKAMVVTENEDKTFSRAIVQRKVSDLPEGELLIAVAYSSLNYKDALSASGNKGVTRNFPHTPGIDAAGTVVESSAAHFAKGDEVVVTGFDLGANTDGGFAQYVRVPASWAVKRPAGLTLKEAMVYGTAGFTAALSVLRLQESHVEPSSGDILVTGATGGVGCLAVGILAQAGYRVVAATGKTTEKSFLTRLGAAEVVSRETVDDQSGRPLSKSLWAGVVDSVGGNILATAIKSTNYGGVVTCCGNVASAELHTTVFPFILRDVRLIGIATPDCPADIRATLWQKMSTDWKLSSFDAVTIDCSLEKLEEQIEKILKGQIRGRVVVDVNA
jgi:acrylyl-CoA reductase (NADPH)